MSTVTTISTHVLDVSLGAPAANITITLERIEGQGVATLIGGGVTNADGRVASLASPSGELSGGSYRLCFDVHAYFSATKRTSFYRTICIDFQVADAPQHYHVPLLLSPFGYSTYRGS